MQDTDASDRLLPRGTDKCKCSTCGFYFGSTYAFDRHRKGGVGSRTCMAERDLAISGWRQDANGHWRTPARTAKSPIPPRHIRGEARPPARQRLGETLAKGMNPTRSKHGVRTSPT